MHPAVTEAARERNARTFWFACTLLSLVFAVFGVREIASVRRASAGHQATPAVVEPVVTYEDKPQLVLETVPQQGHEFLCRLAPFETGSDLGPTLPETEGWSSECLLRWTTTISGDCVSLAVGIVFGNYWRTVVPRETCDIGRPHVGTHGAISKVVPPGSSWDPVPADWEWK